MSVGTGIFLSTLLVLFALGVRYVTVNRKWPTVGKVVGLIVSLSILAGGATWAWFKYQDRPTAVSDLDGISLGMTAVDVKLLKGAPTSEKSDKNEKTGKPILTWGFKAESFDPQIIVWLTSDDSDDTPRVYRVCNMDGYPGVLNVDKYTSEKALFERLGAPSATSISKTGTLKLLSFEPYQVAFELEKGQVSSVCVTKSAIQFIEEYGGSTDADDNKS